jgi:hypothetical protein
MALYFLHGSFLWQGLQATEQQTKDELVLQQKQQTGVEELCRGLPPEIPIDLIMHTYGVSLMVSPGAQASLTTTSLIGVRKALWWQQCCIGKEMYSKSRRWMWTQDFRGGLH